MLIAHRRNTAAELRATPPSCGVEVDIRSQGSRLILQHDPFAPGEAFDDWLDGYRHRTLILNVKEEGLEDVASAQLRERSIDDYFFLDQSFPFLLKTALRGEHRCAVRVSEFESIDTSLALAGKVDWVWVDLFSRLPLDASGWRRLTAAGFRTCLVSPDLLGRTDPAEVHALRLRFAEWGVEPDAVCVKLHAMEAWTAPLDYLP
jgi:hypothetical protein